MGLQNVAETVPARPHGPPPSKALAIRGKMRPVLRDDSGQRSDTSTSRRGSHHVLLVTGLAVVAFVMAVVIAKQLFPLYTRNPDDVAYVVQSRLVEQGKLTLPAKTQGRFFRPALSGPRGDKVLFVYTPEW